MWVACKHAPRKVGKKFGEGTLNLRAKFYSKAIHKDFLTSKFVDHVY